MHPESPPRKGLDDQVDSAVQSPPATAVAAQMDGRAISPRSDAAIAQSAEHALAWTSSLPLSGIKVEVAQGWVTLSGELDWEYQRKLADRAVRHLMGVTGVTDMTTLRG